MFTEPLPESLWNIPRGSSGYASSQERARPTSFMAVFTVLVIGTPTVVWNGDLSVELEQRQVQRVNYVIARTLAIILSPWVRM